MPPAIAMSADGTPVAYRAGGVGDPIVLVHGAATSGRDWVFAARELRDRFTVVTMDRRGRGDSGDATSWDIEREAQDILAVLDAVGAELLVGHSFGGLCSIVAAQQTDRLRRLVLYEPPISIPPEALPGRQLLRERVQAGELDAALIGFLRSAGAPPDQLDVIRSSPAWPVLLDAVPVLPRELEAAAQWRNPAGPVDIPMLLLVGGDTTGAAYLDGLDELQSAFTDARRALIPGQQHLAHVFAAPEFARLVGDFCTS
jgi:pimeloyl-ACP methyl ester carboxylesterase